MRHAAAVLCALVLLTACATESPTTSSPPSPSQPTATAPQADEPAPLQVGSREVRLEGPFVHERLAVFVVRADDTDHRQFITLAEGLDAKSVVIREKGGERGEDDAEVNELVVVNDSDAWLFLQAGDVLIGGKQDRTVAADIAIEPRSGPRTLDAFCVEQGRWQIDADVEESAPQFGAAATFSASFGTVSGRALKRAIQEESDQGRVWQEVARVNRSVEGYVPADSRQPADPGTPTTTSGFSFGGGGGGGGGAVLVRGRYAVTSEGGAITAEDVQETLNGLDASGTFGRSLVDPKVVARKLVYTQRLSAEIERFEDAVGLVFVIGGEVAGAEIYASSQLLRSLAPRLLDAYAVEALLESKIKAASVPAIEMVHDFLVRLEGAEGNHRRVEGRMSMSTRRSDEEVLFEYRSVIDGKSTDVPLHSSYVGK